MIGMSMDLDQDRDSLLATAAALYSQLVESTTSDLVRCNVCSHKSTGFEAIMDHLVTCHRELLESEGTNNGYGRSNDHNYPAPTSIASAMKRRRRSRMDDSDGQDEQDNQEEEGDSLLHVKPSPIATKTRSRKRDTTAVSTTRIIDEYGENDDEDEDFEIDEEHDSGGDNSDNTESESSNASEDSDAYSNGDRGRAKSRHRTATLSESTVRSKRGRQPAGRRAIKSSLYQKSEITSSTDRRARKGASVPCSTNNGILSEDDDFMDDDISGLGGNSEEIRKNRLQKLLNKTDRIVTKMELSLKDFIAQTLLMTAKEKEVEQQNREQAETEKDRKEEKEGKGGEDKEEEEGDSMLDMTANTTMEHEDGPLTATTSTTTAGAESEKEQEQEMTLQTPYLKPGSVLRDYQIGGVEWLSSLHAQGLNGILADEMGLGKTLQILSFLYNLWDRYDIWGPHIIVMPLSVLSSWQSETKRFTNGIFDVYVHHGQKEERHDSFNGWKARAVAMKKLVSKQLTQTTTLGGALKRGSDGGGRESEGGKDVYNSTGSTDLLRSSALRAGVRISLFLTTYDIAIKDGKYLQKIGTQQAQAKWQYLIVDEAHRLKNR